MSTSKDALSGERRQVGSRPVRHDGADKVSGRALYGADYRPPGLLHGKVLRSPHAHARIKSIDTSRAEAHPGVMAVVTSDDLATVGPVAREAGLGADLTVSQNVLAKDKAMYMGHAVAAVAATDAHVAEEALSLIHVEYEPLSAVFDIEEAMKPGAPILHEHWSGVDGAGDFSAGPTNVAAYDLQAVGDVGEGFSAADLVIEREFRTAAVHQGYIEPLTATAQWSPDDRLTLWCSSQGHFGIRENAARIIGVPVSRIKVVPMEVGGGFGGKIATYLEPVVAVLSRKSGRPVRITMTRGEVFEATGPTSASRVLLKMGVTKEGRITAGQARFVLEAGAFPGASIGHAAHVAFAPYDIQNLRVEGYDVVVNRAKAGAYRAPGAPMAAFAAESVVDEICERLGMDRVAFRLLNAAGEGSRRVDGVLNVRIGARETMEAVRDHPHYSTPLEGRCRGRGVGMGFSRNVGGLACVVANVQSDGTVGLVEGSADLSGSRTAVAQQFAEVLGIPVEAVSPVVADTDTIGYTSASGGSSTIYKSGWAAHDAARDVIRQLIERAAMLWDVAADQVDYAEGVLQHKSDTELRVTFAEMAALLPETGGPIVGRGNLDAQGVHSSFTANLADVEVDPETGKVALLRYTAFQDVGKAVHPDHVEGQLQGGTAQGIGWALNEEYYFNDGGQMLNASFLDYRMPTAPDLPMIEAVIVEVPSPRHPFGVRGVGEASIVPPLGTLANAIYAAVGVRMRELPMTPQSILKALKEKARRGDG